MTAWVLKLSLSRYNDMRKETKLSEIRVNLQKEVRKSNLHKIFKENRERMMEEVRKQDKEEFDRIYPTIDQDNFGTHLPFIAKFSQHPDYNFRMLPFAPYLYDYLLQHPSDSECLSILQNLSQFQEVEVPLTQDLASILILNLKQQCRRSLTIIGNLLQHSKYISGLREHLIEANFVSIAQENIGCQNQPKQTIDLLFSVYFEILVIMVSTHPVLETPLFQQLTNKIYKHLNQQDQDCLCILFDHLEDLTSSLLEDEHRAAVIISSFSQLMLKEYFSFEREIVSILLYCLKSKVAVDSKFHPLLAKSLTSSQNNVKDKVILTLDLIPDKIELSHLVHGYPQFLPDLVRAFHISQSWTKIKIMGLLEKLVSIYLGADEGEMVEETGNIEVLLQICEIARQGLEGNSMELRDRSIDLLFGLLSALEETSEELEAISNRLQQNKIFEILGKLSLSSETKKKGECILALGDKRRSMISSSV